MPDLSDPNPLIGIPVAFAPMIVALEWERTAARVLPSPSTQESPAIVAGR